MGTCSSCGSVGAETAVLPIYEAVGLGAPFKVFLEHAVKVDTCVKCGNRLGTFIPDMEGLFHAVVFARALEPRKLTGAELRFMRKAMGWKAKGLAKHLGVSAEHLSRCENSAKVMAPATEKLFRLYALLKTPDTAALGELDMSAIFDMIEIEPTWDVSKPLAFYFVRRPAPSQPVHEGDEKWRKETLKAA